MKIICLLYGCSRRLAQLVHHVDILEIAAILVFHIIKNQTNLIACVGNYFSLKEVGVPVEDSFKLGLMFALYLCVDGWGAVDYEYC